MCLQTQKKIKVNSINFEIFNSVIYLVNENNLFENEKNLREKEAKQNIREEEEDSSSDSEYLPSEGEYSEEEEEVNISKFFFNYFLKL